jgi:hypothetical protein
MQHKVLKLSVLFLSGLGLTGLQAQTIYLKEKSGTQIAHTLSSVQKMTFSEVNMTVHKTDNSTGVYALSGIRYLSFEGFTTVINEQVETGNDPLIAYPNPVTDVLTIDLGDMENEGTICIFSLEGKMLQEQKTEGTNIVKLNLSSLPQGIYICRYSNAGVVKTLKINKQ